MKIMENMLTTGKMAEALYGFELPSGKSLTPSMRMQLALRPESNTSVSGILIGVDGGGKHYVVGMHEPQVRLYESFFLARRETSKVIQIQASQDKIEDFEATLRRNSRIGFCNEVRFTL